MKRKPIEAKAIGCGVCSNNYETLPKRYYFNGCGVHIYMLRIDSKCIDIDKITLEDVFSKYKTEFEKAECVEISIVTPLHDETYELCKENNEFLLVEQGMGYA